MAYRGRFTWIFHLYFGMTSQILTGKDELTVASFALSDVSPKDKHWDRLRAATDEVRDLYTDIDHTDYADRMSQCSNRLTFSLCRQLNNEELKFILLGARFCRVRHCPVCQSRKTMMWRARFFKVIPKILQDYPSARFLFLTLTLKNCRLENLRGTIQHMNKAWRKLVRRKSFPAIGWIKSIEITRGKDGLAHPHFHIILMVKTTYFNKGYYLSQQDWTELWRQSLKVDYYPIVNVKAIKGKGDQDAIFIALCETLKYSVKEEDLKFDKHWLEGLTKQLHGTRSIGIGGVFKDYLSEDEPEDLIHTDTEEEDIPEDAPEFSFTWKEMITKYMSE
mgnify:CR=1 FL=1